MQESYLKALDIAEGPCYDLRCQHHHCSSTWVQRAMTASGAPFTNSVSWSCFRHLTLIIFLSLLNSSWLICSSNNVNMHLCLSGPYNKMHITAKPALPCMH